MVEKDKVFQSKIKFEGFFPFEDFYKFCYEWLRDETALIIFSEKKYKEKIKGDAKNVEIEWVGERELTDYFKLGMEINFKIIGMTEVEITEGNKKIKTNKGTIEIIIKGNLLRDYKGRFEKNAFLKFLRGIYEKMVIPSRVDEFQTKVNEECDEFLSQAKAYLDLEGKR